MPIRVVQVVRHGFATQWKDQWGRVTRPRPFLERVAVVAMSLTIVLIALIVLLAVAVVAVPVALVMVGAAWVRALLPRRRHDGRRNVRVRLPVSGQESVSATP